MNVAVGVGELFFESISIESLMFVDELLERFFNGSDNAKSMFCGPFFVLCLVPILLILYKYTDSLWHFHALSVSIILCLFTHTGHRQKISGRGSLSTFIRLNYSTVLADLIQKNKLHAALNKIKLIKLFQGVLFHCRFHLTVAKTTTTTKTVIHFFKKSTALLSFVKPNDQSLSNVEINIAIDSYGNSDRAEKKWRIQRRSKAEAGIEK